MDAIPPIFYLLSSRAKPRVCHNPISPLQECRFGKTAMNEPTASYPKSVKTLLPHVHTTWRSSARFYGAADGFQLSAQAFLSPIEQLDRAKRIVVNRHRKFSHVT